LFGYLFGSVLTVDKHDLIVIGVVAVGVFGVTLALRKELFAVCYDEEVAKVSGLPVRALNMLIAVTAAVTVAVAMRVVGILLVSALLVLPVAAVQQLTGSFTRTYWAGIALGLSVSVGGVVLAYYADVRPASTIVLTALLAFVVAGGIARSRSVTGG
jgi:zinc transport system permease protein